VYLSISNCGAEILSLVFGSQSNTTTCSGGYVEFFYVAPLIAETLSVSATVYVTNSQTVTAVPFETVVTASLVFKNVILTFKDL
jgi:hypothetical protein